jgi:hypothetical protein
LHLDAIDDHAQEVAIHALGRVEIDLVEIDRPAAGEQAAESFPAEPLDRGLDRVGLRSCCRAVAIRGRRGTGPIDRLVAAQGKLALAVALVGRLDPPIYSAV